MAGLPAASPVPLGGISWVKPQLEELNHQGGKKGPAPHLLPAPPAPSLLLSPLHAGVTATKPGGHRGGRRAPWPKRDPRQKVMQPFRKAAALGAGWRSLIGANEEERGWLLHYMAAAGYADAYTPFSLKVLGITLDI